MLQVLVFCLAAEGCRPFLAVFPAVCSSKTVEAVEDRKKDTTLYLGPAVRFLRWTCDQKSSQLKSRLRMTFCCHQTPLPAIFMTEPSCVKGKQKRSILWSKIGRYCYRRKPKPSTEKSLKAVQAKTPFCVSPDKYDPHWMCNHNSNYKSPDS